ncbi:MAG: glycosyltransferase, partial [Solirubrobacterales bacterium]
MLEALFWISAALIVYAQAGYPLVLWLLARLRRHPTLEHPAPLAELPQVSLIIPAHDEAEVIADRVANALALDYPRDRLQLIVASDGSADGTAQLAREAGADLVLDLPRAGKIPTQNTAVKRATGEILAFSDANSFWQPDALLRLVEPFAEPEVGYVCGQLRFTDGGGDNQEGLYWRYEMAVRELES